MQGLRPTYTRRTTHICVVVLAPRAVRCARSGHRIYTIASYPMACTVLVPVLGPVLLLLLLVYCSHVCDASDARCSAAVRTSGSG